MLSLNAVTYVNTGSSGSPTYVAQQWIKDEKLGGSMDKAESSTRGSGGFKLNEAAMLDIPMSGNALFNPADTQFTNALANFFTRTAKEYAFASEPIATSGCIYIRAACVFTKFETSRDLNGNIMVDWELSPCLPTNVSGTTANPTLNTV